MSAKSILKKAIEDRIFEGAEIESLWCDATNEGMGGQEVLRPAYDFFSKGFEDSGLEEDVYVSLEYCYFIVYDDIKERLLREVLRDIADEVVLG